MPNVEMEDVFNPPPETIKIEDEDDDPIVNSFDIYIKPQVSADAKLYVLQFPNRDAKSSYSKNNHSQPTALRVKEKSGMVEMDVPIDAWRNYDRLKGIQWGDALKQNNDTKGTGSHGLPGGFGIGGANPTGRGRGRGLESDDARHHDLLQDYAGAMERDQVLTKQTLGGQAIHKDETTPKYMIGAFRGKQLHLTPVDEIVQMRPQFHHVDAKVEEDLIKKAQNREVPVRTQEARAIYMTVKSAIDGEEDTTDTIAERIQAVQAEPWKNYRYIDEDSPAAWETFEHSMFVGADKGFMTDDELQTHLPKLVSTLPDGKYLDAISAPRTKKEGNLKSEIKTEAKAADDGSKEPKGKGKAVDGTSNIKGKGKAVPRESDENLYDAD